MGNPISQLKYIPVALALLGAVEGAIIGAPIDAGRAIYRSYISPEQQILTTERRPFTETIKNLEFTLGCATGLALFLGVAGMGIKHLATTLYQSGMKAR